MASNSVEDEHMGTKSQQMRGIVSKIEGSVLNLFSKLTSVSEKQRVASGIYILNYLRQIEAQFENDEICLETSYTLNRLIRGLASPKVCSRAGFFSTLVGLLSTFRSIKVDHVFAAIEKELQSTGSKTKGEIGEIYSGRVLAYGALIESSLFLKGTAEQQKEILKNLLEAGSKKSYLSLAATSFIVKILKNVDETVFHDVVWPALKDEVCKEWENQTLETLYILLLSSNMYPSVVKKKYLAKHLGTAGVIVESSLEACCKLLMESSVYGAIKHPVYEEFCKQLTESEYLLLFWESGIDPHLSKPTHKKIMLAVEMLIYILKHLKETSLIPALLSSNFMMTVVKSFSGKKTENPVVDKIQQLLDLTVKALEGATDKCRIAVIKKMLFYPGNLFFEKHSGTKTVQLITKQLSSEGVKKLAKIYRNILNGSSSHKNGPNETDQQLWTGWERLYAAQMLTRLMGHPAVQADVDWKMKQLHCFINMGLFNMSPSENELAVKTPLAAGLKGCFFRALDHRLPKLDDLRNLLGRVVHYINGQMLNSENPVTLRQALSEKSLQAWREMVNVVEQFEQKIGDGSDNIKEQKASVIPVFHTMFLHMGLQLFSDPAMAEEALQELHSCLAHTKSGTRRSRRIRESQIEDGEPHWVEVAVDLVLSLLSHNSHLLRSIVGCIFPHLCAHLTPTALHQILDVLDPNSQDNPLTGSGGLSGSEDDSDDDDDSDSSEQQRESEKQKESKNTDLNKSSTAKKINTDDDAPNSSGSPSEASDSEDVFSDDADEDMNVNDKVRMAVQQALGGSAPLTDTESIDLDEMDEAEGKRLDAALSQAFSLLKQNKTAKQNKKQSRDERALTHFRIRVVDLLEMYLGTEPDMSLCADMLLPLFDLLEFCIRDAHQRPLEIRVGNCLKKLSNVKKFSSVSGVTQKLLAEILTKLLDKGERKAAVYIDMNPKITMCCTFILRCSEHLKQTHIENSQKKKSKSKTSSQDIVDIYKTALEMFFKKRDCLLQVNLFDAVLKILWDGNWTLAPVLVSAAFSPEVRPFRRSQALDLLMAFYRNHRLLTAADEHQKKILAEIESMVSENSIKLLTQLSEPAILKNAAQDNKSGSVAHGVKQKFVCELLKLLQLIKQSHEKCEAESSIDWQAITPVLSSYRECAELATDTKAVFNRLCSFLGISVEKVTKRADKQLNGVILGTHEEKLAEPARGSDYTSQEDVSETSDDSSQENVNEEDEVESDVEMTNHKEKKKRKHSKHKALMKKESKQLRLNAVSEGMEAVTFSGIDIADIRTDGREGIAIPSQNSHKASIDSSDLGGHAPSPGNVSSKKKRKHSPNENVSGKKKRNSI